MATDAEQMLAEKLLRGDIQHVAKELRARAETLRQEADGLERAAEYLDRRVEEGS